MPWKPDDRGHPRGQHLINIITNQREVQVFIMHGMRVERHGENEWEVDGQECYRDLALAILNGATCEGGCSDGDDDDA
jgi:hypothetical protein